ncbi:MAG: aconitate hydratase AcnA [Pseudobdellovibrionaceae bacterium]
MKSLNTFGTLSEVEVKGTKYKYHSLPALEKKIGKKMETLPFSIRVLLENLLRYEDGAVVTKGDVEALINWDPKKTSDKEIQFRPARVILQDFTGVPVVADLAAMRAAMKKWGGDPLKINPLQPVDLVVDHSVQVDYFGTADALQKNSNLEFQRNQERYEFLKWAQASFKNFTVVPPATGIVHQVNLEYLARVAMTQATDAGNFIFPDTVIGTDSHTPMVNGLGVVGWGVGGIEAEAAMLGQPCTMLIPDVVGFRLKGKMPAGTTATDLVLTVVQMLRKKGVVGKFVEFFGPGCLNLSVADRATISNMAPEYGATIGIFPIDQKTLDFLKLTNREEKAQLTEAYYKAQGMFFNESTPDPVYSDVLELDLATLEPSLAGPARPQDRTSLAKVNESFRNFMKTQNKDTEIGVKTADVTGQNYKLGHGSVVIAAITSCTNTSNPSVMIGAGLLAKKAVEKGLTVKPWVKTSLAPGSKVVTEYLKSSGLLSYLEKLNFNVVGYGCTTCIGNSGPLPEAIQDSVLKNDLSVASVLSGNRNFEARVHPHVRANYLASPPLVVAYALAGSVNMDLTKEPIGTGADGKPVFLNDIFPTSEEVEQFVHKNVTLDKFKSSYGDVFKGSSEWQAIKVEGGDLYK